MSDQKLLVVPIADGKKIVNCILLDPIGQHPTTGYPEMVCPGCKRHFYWRKADKAFYCSCGFDPITVNN